MKAHAMTWAQVQDMMEGMHVAYDVNTHRPTMVVAFYPVTADDGSQRWAAAALVAGRFFVLSKAQAADIAAILQRDEPSEGLAEA